MLCVCLHKHFRGLVLMWVFPSQGRDWATEFKGREWDVDVSVDGHKNA